MRADRDRVRRHRRKIELAGGLHRIDMHERTRLTGDDLEVRCRGNRTELVVDDPDRDHTRTLDLAKALPWIEHANCPSPPAERFDRSLQRRMFDRGRHHDPWPATLFDNGGE